MAEAPSLLAPGQGDAALPDDRLGTGAELLKVAREAAGLDHAIELPERRRSDEEKTKRKKGKERNRRRYHENIIKIS